MAKKSKTINPPINVAASEYLNTLETKAARVDKLESEINELKVEATKVKGLISELNQLKPIAEARSLIEEYNKILKETKIILPAHLRSGVSQPVNATLSVFLCPSDNNAILTVVTISPGLQYNSTIELDWEKTQALSDGLHRMIETSTRLRELLPKVKAAKTAIWKLDIMPTEIETTKT